MRSTNELLNYWVSNGFLPPMGVFYLIQDGVLKTTHTGWNGYYNMDAVKQGGVYLTMTSGFRHRTLYTLQPIDITDYSKLKITMYHSMSLRDYAWFGVSKSELGGPSTIGAENIHTKMTSKVDCNKGAIESTFEIDISDLTGGYYIGYDSSNASKSDDYNVFIRRLWLE